MQISHVEETHVSAQAACLLTLLCGEVTQGCGADTKAWDPASHATDREVGPGCKRAMRKAADGTFH